MQRVRHRIFSGLKYTALQKILIQVLSVVTFFLIINSLSLAEYGIYNLLFTIVSVATTITELGINRLVVADIAVYRAREAFSTINKLVREYTLLNVVILLITFVCAWFFKGYVTHFFDTNLEKVYWILVLLITAQVGMNVPQAIFESHEKFAFTFSTIFSESLIRAILIIGIFFWSQLTLWTVLWAYIISKCIGALLSIFLAAITLKAVSIERDKNSVLYRIFRGHGKWEASKVILSTAAGNATPWIVQFFVGTEGVAIYSFVLKIRSIFIKVVPLRSVLFPIIAHSIEKNWKLASKIITKAKKYLFFLYLVIYGFIFILIDLVVAKFAPQYTGSEYLVMLAMLKIFIDVFSLGQGAILYALKEQKLMFGMGMANMVSITIAQIIFTKTFGIAGAIMSVIVVALFSVVFREYVLAKRFHFPITTWKEFWAFDEYDKLILKQLKARLLKRKVF